MCFKYLNINFFKCSHIKRKANCTYKYYITRQIIKKIKYIYIITILT